MPTLIVAGDGSKGSDAAFKAAQLIAEVNDVEVRVVSVIEPLPLPAVVPPALLDLSAADAARVKDLNERIYEQVKEHETQRGCWQLETLLGVPATEVSQYARDCAAQLIVVGTTHHGLLDRLTGEETAARIAQISHIPVLAAAPQMQRLPHRVVIAMDLDPSQLGDLTPVLALFGRASSVTCVHVQKPEEFPGSDSPTFARAYDRAVNESFNVTRSAVKNANGMRAELVRLNGDPSAELLRYAELAKAELLVLGLRRHFGLRRLLGGGVALNVLRKARCSVLIVPETGTIGPDAVREL
jgi:nucleotide-binding universal stress UspA family protein